MYLCLYCSLHDDDLSRISAKILTYLLNTRSPVVTSRLFHQMSSLLLLCSFREELHGRLLRRGGTGARLPGGQLPPGQCGLSVSAHPLPDESLPLGLSQGRAARQRQGWLLLSPLRVHICR